MVEGHAAVLWVSSPSNFLIFEHFHQEKGTPTVVRSSGRAIHSDSTSYEFRNVLPWLWKAIYFLRVCVYFFVSLDCIHLSLGHRP